ncbi:SDR family oxidoreductase [Pedobacter alpinus]|uniref:dTDP-4-dehydrorhamnose reductase n=1 Tax=Pedobacter alpinus TaxID=1590643 RepID=A0ABW5TR58_9SPHI
MNILIVGASGLVGGNIYHHLKAVSEFNIYGTYNSFEVPNLIRFNSSINYKSYPKIILETAWDVIIHTGALTNVDFCEENIADSEYYTVESTINLVKLSKVHHSKLIYISTDYIFDGKDGPYREDAQVNPLSIYGKHKLISENIVSQLNDYLILRITNVYGDELRNKNFLSRITQDLLLGNEKSVSGATDQFASPINALDIAKAIFNLIIDDKKGVYHLASTDYLSRVQFLQIIKKYFNLLKIESYKTSDLKQKAERPLRGGLNAEKFLTEYSDFHFTNIDDYILKLLKAHDAKL